MSSPLIKIIIYSYGSSPPTLKCTCHSRKGQLSCPPQLPAFQTSYIRFSFWNPNLLLQKKEFLLRFLYAFGFCNQVKSLAPKLKILLVFLCKVVANQLQQSKVWCRISHILGSVHHWLVMYWDSCIERRDSRYNISLIGYSDKGSTVGWYEVLGFLLLVTTCFDNSGFSGVVTLNSPGGDLPRWFSPFVNKSPVSNLFSAVFNLVGDLFVLPHLLHVT